MAEWTNRPLDRVYPVVFIDAIHVKVRDGQVRNKPFYILLGVTVNGERDILGIWAGDGGEGAKYWLGVLTEIKNRGVEDVCVAVCDGLKGLPEAITTVWEQATVQTCVIHYADLRIMPMWPRDPLQGMGFVPAGRHNQRASSQAMRLSGGWYRPARPLGGLVLSSAFSLSSRSACR